MKNYLTKFNVVICLYFTIFFVIPFFILGYKVMIITQDPSWFIWYMFLIFPLSFLFLLFIVNSKYGKKLNNYKKKIAAIFLVFVLLYIFSFIYTYNMIIYLFSNVRHTFF